MEKPIVTALLAYGMSGKVFHAPFLATHKGFELYAVLERNIKKAAIDYPEIISYSTINELLSDEKIELVVINTPNNTHFDYAKLVLETGKHILLEKPATSTPEEFEILLALAEKVNRQVFVYQNRRWSSDITSAKNIINSGKLGDIVEMHLRFDRYRPNIGAKTFKETPIPSSGIWYDLGSHLIDQAIAIFGKPVSHYRYKNSYRENSLVDDFAFMHIVFPNKVNVFITTNMLVTDAQAGIIIHGTKGSYIKEFCDEQEDQLIQGMLPTDAEFGIEKPNREGKLTYYSNQEKITEIIPSLKGNFNGLFDALYESIRNKKPFPVDNEQIISQLKLLV
ncbi:Gfo/Idh/MocA family oxidoreductase [Flavobacterium sp. J49]|uniref:Gfo/Idh/MocA family oxidoreductase n=1 Tax=Flavobacterium sp. J49 TaxID=2718534 RepID=UPI001593AE53|nr:Gfo/Idh/MocA family oxidoreductase [Flavobacterium sp. J49]MBF6640985.1 Gfo/Idh/MocA family oxidoreductase [Flavobacterium sp. J49]NIC02232.1 Gfo/Idh/MocA family oxidoreductase [Flavobacterium sp. J49]